MIQKEIDKIKKEIDSIVIENHENHKRLIDLQDEARKLSFQLFEDECLKNSIWKLDYLLYNRPIKLLFEAKEMYDFIIGQKYKISEFISIYQRFDLNIEIEIDDIDSFFEFVQKYNMKTSSLTLEKITKFYNDFNEKLKDLNK
jgi:hypothetical protein